ncbi:conjugal transfer protein TraF [Sphingobium sp. SYK-6]|uniref:S26 family signal peptidase n=1 Tax=Sphingobium sp. (strain NBRC 103272 / SYK-6) TaxID=627192 RepID=UPI0002277729|nr:S26 family signal peptidase [Sphingobium sp. SYK-6]BAK67290.1 conjugal transfer protein TraF [Sphingobium sp. SYK-6]
MSGRGLSRWGDALRDARQRRRTLRHRAAILGIGVACLAATIALPPRQLLVWNTSASAPVGLYAVTAPERIRTGDMVIAWPPETARRLGAERRYIPFNVPLVKRVAAAPGDRVCASGSALSVNDRTIARRLTTDARGRPMPWWTGCVTLRDGALLLLMDNPASFDGRYFGPTQADGIIGKAHLLWRR